MLLAGKICLDLAVQVQFCHSNHFFRRSHGVDMVFVCEFLFLCQFGQNPSIGSGDEVQTMIIFTVFIVW